MTKANISEYEELEQRLIEKDAQFREYFTTTGVIGDQKIKDPKKRESQQKKRRRLYQNTQVLMENYQTIVWVVQNFPETIAEELNEPFEEVDNLIERVDLEFSLENQRLENRIRSISKSRVLIDRVNEALTTETVPAEGEEGTVAGIPVTHIALFGGGLIVAIGALVGINFYQKRSGNSNNSDDDDD